jgi:organic hydroperoxide reductase OsmC/OhrA
MQLSGFKQDGLARRPKLLSQQKSQNEVSWIFDRFRSRSKAVPQRLVNTHHSSGKGGQTDVPVACSVDIGRAIYKAEAHKGVGGGGSGACSGDLLLGALAACAQITCQMVAAAMGIPTERIEVTVEGDLDLRGTLGIAKDVSVGFAAFVFI